jgi:aminopeptidase YwaD
VAGPLVYAGLGYADDFRNVNVRGRIALVERGEIRFSEKVQNAEAAGAVAVVVYNSAEGPIQASLGSASRIPAVAIARADGVALRRAGNVSVRLNVNGSVKETTAFNVIGTLPGRTGDTLIFGGHYDSVPAGPGANDNGSGTGAALEAARVLAAQGGHNLTLRFIAFGAEENGLLGSKAYVESLSAAQRRQVVAMINLDMVGVGDTWMVGGTRELQTPVRAAGEGMGVRFRDLSADLNGASDHASFIAAGIPAVFIYSSDDPNYHSPNDKVEFVQPERLETAGKILLSLVAQLDRR